MSEARLLTGSRAVPSLPSRATSRGTVTGTVSTCTAGVTSFLLASSDHLFPYTTLFRSNSLIVYGLLPLPGLPDLTETSVTNPPATVLDGSSFSVTDTVQNDRNSTRLTSSNR